jgi:protein phosphatase PTC7
MKQSYHNLSKGGDANVGSSTATFLVLDRSTGRLVTANLGNSGYLILRNGKVIFRSEAQMFGLMDPYHLSLYPSSWKKKGPIKKRLHEEFNSDGNPMMAWHTVHAGDVIIVASDGLFDNVYEDDIERIVQTKLTVLNKNYPSSGKSAKHTSPRTTVGTTLLGFDNAMSDLSHTLTVVASLNARKKRGRSPYSDAATDAGVLYEGGKEDDITIVAAYVHPAPPPASVVKTETSHAYEENPAEKKAVETLVNMRHNKKARVEK